MNAPPTDIEIARALHPDRDWPDQPDANGFLHWRTLIDDVPVGMPWRLDHPSTTAATLEALTRLELGVIVMPISLENPDAPFRLAIETPHCDIAHGFGATMADALAVATRRAFALGFLA